MNPKWAETEATKAQLKVLSFFGYDISQPSSRLDAASEMKSIFQVKAYRDLGGRVTNRVSSSTDYLVVS